MKIFLPIHLIGGLQERGGGGSLTVMLNRKRAASLIGISVFLAFSAAAKGEDCQDRLTALRAWAQSAEPSPFVATVRVWNRPSMTEAQARAALANIEGITDHPDRSRLERALLEALNDGWNEEYIFWHLSQTRQRIAVKRLHPNPQAEGRTDLAVDGRNAWSLGDSSMILVDTRKPPPNTELDKAVADIYRSTLDSLRNAGLNPHLSDARVESCQTTPDGRWTGRLAWSGGSSEIEVTGTVQPGGELRVEEVRVTKTTAASGLPNTRTRLSNFQNNPAWGRPIATLSERLDSQGQPVRRVRLVSIEPLDRAAIESYLVVPRDGETDPLVGPVSLTTISDLRPGGEGAKYRSGNSWTLIEEVRQDAQSRNRQPVIAVICAVVALAAISWFAWNRKGT